MEELKNDLEQVIENTFDILRSGCSKTRLVFPTYSNGKRRVCEQELRFMFVEQLQPILQKYNLYYSVETPTIDGYIFSEKRKYVEPHTSSKGQSASFDLTIKDSNGNNVVIVEFKAKNAHQHEYAKDIYKLWNSKEVAKYKYFINLFEKIEKKTEKSFRSKLLPKDPNESNQKVTNEYLLPKESSEQIIVYAQSLRENDKEIKLTI